MNDDAKLAVETLSKALRENPSLYYAYQANIAMAFKNEMVRNGHDFPTLHDIANIAAKNFLDLLIKTYK